MSDRTEKEPETGQKEEAAVHEEKEKVQEEKEKAPVRKIGRYMPQAQMAAQMRAMGDKASVEYQRLSWIALGKSLTGLVNKVSATNIEHIVVEVFRENLVRGRGLLCRALMRAQRASPAFTPVYAALVAVVNTKVPDVGELLLVRLVDQLRKAYRRNDRAVLLATVRFLAHLLNQRVADVSLGLELCALLLERPTEDSVEVAVEFVREAGYTLQEESPRGMGVVFESFRAVLQEGRTGLRVQYTIEDLFAVRRSDFAGHQGVPDALDLVEEDDQITHDVALDAPLDVHDELNTFRPDPDFLENEAKWRAARHEILGDSDDEDEGGGGGGGGGDADDESGSGDDEDEDENENESNNTAGTVISSESATEAARIADETAMELVNLKKTIYLTIMSSIDFEECAHKLLKMSLKPGQEGEVCRMVVECCSQERTYLRFYGLLAERFCRVSRDYQQLFEQTFLEQYAMIHRLETNKLRNVAKLFAHLFHSDAISWDVLQHVHLNEQETTSSSRIFIKILFQEIAEFMGLARLNARLNDPAKQDVFAGLFPRDTPRNTRFAINFFTSIGLGGLTDELREYLKNMPKQVPPAAAVPAVPAAADSDSSSLSSSTLSSSTSSSSSSSSSLSDSGSGSGSASSSYSSYSSSSSGSGSSASSSDSDSAREPERKKRRSRSKSRSRSRSRSHRRHR